MTPLDKMGVLSTSFKTLGLIVDPSFPFYDCTPRDAMMIGHVGVDGIHFCLIKKSCEIENAPVFVISPMMTDHLVEPISNNIYEFIGLLLACKDASLLECLSYTSEDDFEVLIRAVQKSLTEDMLLKGEVDKATESIKQNFRVKEIDSVYAYRNSII